jgi:hypothetical protein
VAARPSAPDLAQTPKVIVPQLVTDPVWSLRPWPVIVEIGPLELVVPALPAADWLAVLMVENIDPDDLFPGLLDPADAEQVEEALYAGELSLDDFDQAFLNLVTTVSGRPWWVALRLISVARQSWAGFGGEMLLRGVDANRLSLSAWLDVLLLTILRNSEPEAVTMFTLQLEMPPPDEVKKVESELEMSSSAFMAMAGG